MQILHMGLLFCSFGPSNYLTLNSQSQHPGLGITDFLIHLSAGGNALLICFCFDWHSIVQMIVEGSFSCRECSRLHRLRVDGLLVEPCEADRSIKRCGRAMGSF